MTAQKMTTGQMIDQLQVGDIATSATGLHAAYEPSGVLYCWSGEKLENDWINASPFGVSHESVGADTWTIKRKFVDFQEAMQAYTNEGKRVIFYQEEALQYAFEPGMGGTLEGIANDSITLQEMVKGKWIVVNRS